MGLIYSWVMILDFEMPDERTLTMPGRQEVAR
jgi:hypothetical protein